MLALRFKGYITIKRKLWFGFEIVNDTLIMLNEFTERNVSNISRKFKGLNFIDMEELSRIPNITDPTLQNKSNVKYLQS